MPILTRVEGQVGRSGGAGSALRAARPSFRFHPLLWVLVLLTWSLEVRGLDPHRRITQYQEQRWTLSEGLPTMPLYDLTQGATGHLWLAGPQGPFRFDGLLFTRAVGFPLDVPAVAILGTRDGSLWIGTDRGLFVLEDEINGPLKEIPELAGQKIRRLEQDAAGGLWIQTSKALGYLQTGRYRLFPLPAEPTLEVHDFAVDGSEVLYLATSRGLLRLESETSGLEPLIPERPQEEVQVVLRSSAGTLWAATPTGIFQFQEGAWHPVSNAVAFALREDRDGNLWAATAQGLLRLFQGKEELLTFEGLSTQLAPRRLLEDREGALWITHPQALIRLEAAHPVAWTEREGLSLNSVRSVHEDHSGTLWIATDGGGLNSLRNGKIQTFTTADGLADDVLLAVTETAPGTLWVGTDNSGLIRLRGKQLRTFNTGDGLVGDSVAALLAAGDDSLWIGTVGAGISHFGAGRFTNYRTSDGLPSDIVRSLALDRLGRLWIGTEGGLSRFDGTGFTNFSREDGLAGDQVLALLEDAAGDFWIGTDGGLSRLRGESFFSMDRSDGLPSDSVHQILDDGAGHLWLCTNRGLFAVPKTQLAELETRHRDRLAPFRPHGLELRECNGFSQPAATVASNGSLFFSTIDGLVELRPGLSLEETLPRPIVEELRVDGQTVSLLSAPTLAPSTKSIEVRVSSSSSFGAESQLFQYRLEDYSPFWSEPTLRRTVRYTNLPPGPYRFSARTVGQGSEEALSAVQLAFTIAPPFYRTGPFLLAILLVFGVGGRGLYLLRLRQILQRNERLTNRVEESTSQVLTQKQELDRAHRRLSRANERLRVANEQLTELDRENTDLLALAAHGLRGPLLNLQGFSAEMTQVLRELQSLSQSAEALTAEEQRTLQQTLFEDSPEALDFIRASTERMDQLIQAILRLAQLGRQRLEPQFIVTDELVNEVVRSLSYQIVQSRAVLEISPLPSVVADRHALRLVFENLLNNAILYLDPRRPGRIQVRGESRQETVIFQVEDSGRGIPKDQEDVVFKLFGRATNSEMSGEGMGLAYVRAVLERQGGRIWFQSTVDQGTTFTFSLPQTNVGGGKADPHQ